jgi:hypothetical protein
MSDQTIQNQQLKEISSLVDQMLSTQSRVLLIEQQLEEAQKKLRNLSENMIPEAMMAVGMSEFKMDTGEKVSVTKFYSASITSELAFDWLREQGHGDIIKNKVTCEFDKGKDDLANEVAQMLVQKGIQPEQKISVHPQTLKSFVKEKMEAGQEIPQDLITVFVGNKTKITVPNK